MKRYRCKCEYTECEVSTDKDFIPVYCPMLMNTNSEWEKVEEEIKEEEKAKELLSWCKVGEVVYCNDSYYTIVEMNGQYEVKITDGVEDEWVKTSNVQEARLRPFNESEMRELVGKVVLNTKSDEVFLITSYSSNYVGNGGALFDATELLNIYTFTNGQPCGVYEHLENGEWVE